MIEDIWQMKRGDLNEWDESSIDYWHFVLFNGDAN